MASIPLLTQGEARELDLDAASAGVPTLLLMENAGRSAAELLLQHHESALQRIVFLIGPGQNGGDAWVLARHLASRDIEPWKMIRVGTSDPVGDAAVAARACEYFLSPESDITMDDDAEPEEIAEALQGASLIVDAMFGTGLQREVLGVFRNVVEVLTEAFEAGVPIVSLDLPSGLDATTGEVRGCAVLATTTITFAAPKRGLFLLEGPLHAGKVVVASIGIPVPLGEPKAWMFHDVPRLPERSPRIFKKEAGHVLIVGGAPGKSGAALLAAHAAARAGAGYVSLLLRERISTPPTVLAHFIDKDTDAVALFGSLAEACDALVLGPGLGVDALGERLLRAALEIDKPTVLDADALTLVASWHARGGLSIATPASVHPIQGRVRDEAERSSETPTSEADTDAFPHLAAQAAKKRGRESFTKIDVSPPPDNVRSLREERPTMAPILTVSDVLDVPRTRPLVLTPHPGEAARLLQSNVADVERDRFGAAQRLSEAFPAAVVLKGAHSIVATRSELMAMGGFPEPILGVAGSGDVLAGLIGTLLANGVPAHDGAVCGMMIHLHAARRVAMERGVDRGVSPLEVADAFPGVMTAASRNPG